MTKGEFEQQYKEIVKRTLDVVEFVRKKSLLELETIINWKKLRQRDVLEYGLIMACDGADPEFIDKILTNIVNLETDGYFKRLKNIQKESALSIQKGLNLNSILMLLNSHTAFDVEKFIDQMYGNRSFMEVSDYG
jgi:hypothetical protein